MPAIREEVDQVLSEGVRLLELVGPVAVQAGEDGRPAGLVCDRMELADRDGSGRPRPVVVPGSRHTLPCDQVVFATGQATDLDFAGDRRIADDRIATDLPGLFACGDASTGEGTVAAAIGSGRKAALAIHAWLTDEDGEIATNTWAPRSSEVLRFDRVNPSYFEPAPRSEVPRLPVEQRLEQYREVVGEIPDGCHEASRCLSCGTCTGCDNCYMFCPEPAVSRDEGVYTFDFDYCKGCGVCFEECPRGVIDMVEE
jgi:2-oxoacid:acceptor oxidoreductase delta subunit (pyruvate/2-ketoisovalerate family)